MNQHASHIQVYILFMSLSTVFHTHHFIQPSKKSCHVDSTLNMWEKKDGGRGKLRDLTKVTWQFTFRCVPLYRCRSCWIYYTKRAMDLESQILPPEAYYYSQMLKALDSSCLVYWIVRTSNTIQVPSLAHRRKSNPWSCLTKCVLISFWFSGSFGLT